MKEEFYSISRGSLNINGKFYCGLDYEITDFMRSLEEENKQLKEKLQQKEDTINKAKEELYIWGEALFPEFQKKMLKILNNKGE